eukprot:1963509-Pleurochrysis_carterae.AAC.1
MARVKTRGWGEGGAEDVEGKRWGGAKKGGKRRGREWRGEECAGVLSRGAATPHLRTRMWMQRVEASVRVQIPVPVQQAGHPLSPRASARAHAHGCAHLHSPARPCRRIGSLPARPRRQA